MKPTERMPGLFAEAELPVPPAAAQARRARSQRSGGSQARVAPAVTRDWDALRCGAAVRPARPEVESAHYWHAQMMAAADADRKRECYEKMVLSIKGMDRTPTTEGRARAGQRR